MKKITALILAMIMVLSLFAGCQADPAETTAPPTTTAPAGTTAPAVEDTTAAPEIQYPEEVSIFCSLSAQAAAAGMSNYNEAYWAQAMEELTGTHANFTCHSSDVSAEKFNTMIASENWPDAIVNKWRNVEGGMEMYIEDEVLIDLTDLIPKCMPNLTAYLEANPDVRRDIIDDNGRILAIPSIRDQVALNIYVGPQIRTDWLEKLELEVPKTPEDLYNVLKAFKEKDPNGNGEADEIPMSGVGFDNATFGIGNLVWAFDTHYSFYMKDGQVVYGPAEEEFVEGLSYIAKLYDEDLIDMDYLINDRAAMDSKAIMNRVGFEFSYQPTKYYNSADFNNGTNVMAGVPYLTTADNDSLSCFNTTYANKVGDTMLAVTTACEDPEAFLKWLDTVVYSKEGIIAMNYGEEGTHFEYVDGEPQLFEMTAEEYKTYQANTMIVAATFPILQQWGAYSGTLSPWGASAIDVWAENSDISAVMPKLSLTPEENEQIADILTQITTLAQTEMNNVVIGETSIDKWPEIVEQFQDMGLDEILAIYNAAYQRYLAK